MGWFYSLIPQMGDVVYARDNVKLQNKIGTSTLHITLIKDILRNLIVK